jgi:glycosyltransferase involved in cell wall biosynthesis
VKIVAGMLTHNAVRYGRMELAKQTARSLASEADEVIVWDNGSTDGTADWVASIGGHLYDSPDGVTTCGRGMNMLGSACAARGDLVVLTSDDMLWRPGWREVVEAFWTEANPKVAILCGLLEPDYPWSTPVGSYTAGGVTGLLRPSVPGSGWTFRSADWPDIGPVPETYGRDDVPTCQRLVSEGWLLVAVDLADHAGEGASTWGNKSDAYARPLNTQGVRVTTLAASTIGPEVATLPARQV